jgi:hypothetical protein
MIRTLRNLASSALLAGLVAIALTSTARAQLITLSAGDFTINANGYSASTIFSQAPGAKPTSDGPLEDTWGIFQVTSVLLAGTPVFTDNGGHEFWGVFYNSHDTSTTDLGGGDLRFVGTGLKLDIYSILVNDANDTAWATAFNQGPSNPAVRPAIDQYHMITDAGTLALSSSLVGDLKSYYFGSTATTSATGFLKVTYNNMFNVGAGNLSNLVFNLGGDTSAVPAGWSVKFDGPVSGSVSLTPVPEPGTYGIMATGLLMAVIGFRRRSKKNPVAVSAVA